MQFDTSEAGNKLRNELKDRLNDATSEIDDLPYDRNISLQDDTLNDEFDRINEIHNAEIKSIEDAYNVRVERLQDQLEAVNDNAKTEAQIRIEAMNLINQGGQQLYNDLIAYNEKDGDGVKQNIDNQWQNAYLSLQTFGNGQNDVLSTLNSLALKMNDFDLATQSAASSMSDLASAIQDKNDAESDSKNSWQYKLLSYDRLQDGYSAGGVNDYTGTAMLHGTPSKSEVVFNSSDASKLFNLITNTSDLSSLIAGGVLKNLSNFTSGLSAITNTNTSIDQSPSITVNVTGDATQSTVSMLKNTASNIIAQAKKEIFSTMNQASTLGY